MVRGLAYFSLEKYEDCVSDLTKNIKLDPDNIPAHIFYKRAQAYYMMERYNESTADLSRAIRLDPNFASAFGLRGLIRLITDENNLDYCSDWKRACDLGEKDFCDYYSRNCR